MNRTEHRFTAMGGPCCIHADGEHDALTDRAITAAVCEVRRLECKYSRYRPDSLLSAINRAAGSGQALAIDSETSSLLDFADTLWRQSDGLFDPSSGVLRKAWDFQSGKPPRQEDIDKLLPLVGWERVQREPDRVYLPEAGMELDLGGYVKEYAADAAAAMLECEGVNSALVDLGGDLAAVGCQGSGRAWRVGIRNPAEGDQAIASISLAATGLASSGNYERCIDLGGKRYGHILNPRTGWPVDGLAAVSVSAPQCLVAGGIATLAMLQPAVEARSWLASLGLPHLAIDTNIENAAPDSAVERSQVMLSL